jgi:hypothetical protein
MIWAALGLFNCVKPSLDFGPVLGGYQLLNIPDDTGLFLNFHTRRVWVLGSNTDFFIHMWQVYISVVQFLISK